MSEEQATGQAKPVPFDAKHAAAYDKQFERVSPIREAMQLVTRLALGGAPDDARLLCVGAGTGSEILYLAEAFPRWTFVAVDPSAPMLEVCRGRLEEAGVASRCQLHCGLLESLPEGQPFDIATSLLVSHFIQDEEQRHGYFREIARRLRPGGKFVTADIASDVASPTHIPMLSVWEAMQIFSGGDPEKVRDHIDNLEKQIAVAAPHDLARMIAEAGFEPPTPIYQAILIHAWVATKADRAR